ncbi:hypothetical protein [Winogradskyella sp. 3972H.M.0a.05]|uniref:hypothetical protein n=1 Tax=Winogradskyella sp. 3972H.M.0a.05 TaxID=2950277 RepID=UPI00339A9E79
MLDSDSQRVDKILIDNQIFANIESNPIGNFSDEKKMARIYLLTVLVIVVIIVVSVIFEVLIF